MFTDTYPMEEVADAFYMVRGKRVTVAEDDIQLDGANPSAEDGDDGGMYAVQSPSVLKFTNSSEKNSPFYLCNY